MYCRLLAAYIFLGFWKDKTLRTFCEYINFVKQSNMKPDKHFFLFLRKSLTSSNWHEKCFRFSSTRKSVKNFQNIYSHSLHIQCQTNVQIYLKYFTFSNLFCVFGYSYQIYWLMSIFACFSCLCIKVIITFSIDVGQFVDLSWICIKTDIVCYGYLKLIYRDFYTFKNVHVISLLSFFQHKRDCQLKITAVPN